MNKKVLILIPNPSLIGGISNYYSSIMPYLPPNFHFLYRGGRGVNNRIIRAMILIHDIFKFSLILVLTSPSTILINTSISNQSLRRDFIFFSIAKRIFRKQVVVFFRGWNQGFIKSNIDVPKSWFKNSFLKSDKIIVLANSFKDQLRMLGYENPIIVETTTVNSELLVNLEKQKKRQKNSILFLSRIEHSKGIYEILKAIEIIHNKGIDIGLEIAGTGSELSSVINQVKSKKLLNVNFHGFVQGKRKAELYQNSLIYVFPSYHDEGMPNSVLEAMTFGLPIITTMIGGLVDFFEEGKMGIIINQKDPNSLADALIKLIESPNLLDKIGNYNSNYAKVHFSSKITAERLQKHLIN